MKSIEVASANHAANVKYLLTQNSMTATASPAPPDYQFIFGPVHGANNTVLELIQHISDQAVLKKIINGSYYLQTYAIRDSVTLYKRLYNSVKNVAGAIPFQQELRRISFTLKNALHFAVQTGFSHGDLHSGNVLWDGKHGRYTIIDYGRAFIISQPAYTDAIAVDSALSDALAETTNRPKSDYYGAYTLVRNGKKNVKLNLLSSFTKVVDTPDDGAFMMDMDIVGMAVWIFTTFNALSLIQNALPFVYFCKYQSRNAYFIDEQLPDDNWTRGIWGDDLWVVKYGMLRFAQVLAKLAPSRQEVFQGKTVNIYFHDNLVDTMTATSPEHRPILYEGSCMLTIPAWKAAFIKRNEILKGGASKKIDGRGIASLSIKDTKNSMGGMVGGITMPPRHKAKYTHLPASRFDDFYDKHGNAKQPLTPQVPTINAIHNGLKAFGIMEGRSNVHTAHLQRAIEPKPSRMYIEMKATGKQYWVRMDTETNKKYILLNKSPVYLGTIKGQYSHLVL